MQYPGTSSPFGGQFSGADQLTNQLKPNSLEQRKRQLINRLVTGGAGRAAIPGQGMGFRGQGMGAMGFLDEILNSQTVDALPPFFGSGGRKTDQGLGLPHGDTGGVVNPINPPSPAAPPVAAPIAPPAPIDPAQAMQGVAAAAPPQASPVQALGALQTGGYDPYHGLPPALIGQILAAHTRGY